MVGGHIVLLKVDFHFNNITTVKQNLLTLMLSLLGGNICQICHQIERPNNLLLIVMIFNYNMAAPTTTASVQSCNIKVCSFLLNLSLK